jgi:hypothetical protein
MVAIAFPPEARLSPMCFSYYNSPLAAADALSCPRSGQYLAYQDWHDPACIDAWCSSDIFTQKRF